MRTPSKAVVFVVFVAMLAGTPVHAQDTWPAKSVRIIVPSTPGGGSDTYARLMSAALTDSLKQQFVVENRPGLNYRLMKTPEIASKLDAMVFVPVFETPSELAARFTRERERWAAHIRRLGIKVEQ